MIYSVSHHDEARSKSVAMLSNAMALVAGWPVRDITHFPYFNERITEDNKIDVINAAVGSVITEETSAKIRNYEPKMVGVVLTWFKTLWSLYGQHRYTRRRLPWAVVAIDDICIRPGITYQQIETEILRLGDSCDIISFDHHRDNLHRVGPIASVDIVGVKIESIPKIVLDYNRVTAEIPFAPSPQDWMRMTTGVHQGDIINVVPSELRARWEPLEVMYY